MKHVHLRGNLVYGGVFLNEIEFWWRMFDYTAKELSEKHSIILLNNDI